MVVMEVTDDFQNNLSSNRVYLIKQTSKLGNFVEKRNQV